MKNSTILLPQELSCLFQTFFFLTHKFDDLLYICRHHLFLSSAGNRHSNKSKKPQSRYRELVASSSDRTGGESSDPTDGIINFVTDSEDDRAFSSPSPAPTQSDAGFQVDIPRGVTQKFSTSNKHIIHAQIEERNERKGIDVMAVH